MGSNLKHYSTDFEDSFASRKQHSSSEQRSQSYHEIETYASYSGEKGYFIILIINITDICKTFNKHYLTLFKTSMPKTGTVFLYLFLSMI